MKIKKIFNIFIVAALSLVTFSCDDFLDRKPTNQGDSDSAIQSLRDAEVAMNGIIRKMTSSSYYGRNFILYGDVKGGDLGITSQGRGYDALYTFNHNPRTNSYSGYWSQMYHCLVQVNNLLANIDRIGESSYDQIKGEALTARACIHFDLVRLYGQPYSMDKSAYGVPILTRTYNADETMPERSTVEQVYSQILSDLQDGAALMSKSVKKGYFSYYANKAIEARVKLYKEDYDGALTAAEEVMNSGKFSLYTNENWESSWTSEYGKESILEFAIYPDEADLGTSSLGFMLMRYKKKTGASGWFMASDYFLERLGQDKDDIRWSMMENDEIADDKGIERKGCCNKYSLGDKEGTTTAVNIKVIRLSEIYLIAAEAALLKSAPDKKKAADYLQEIRKRSPNLEKATESNVTLDMILDERSKELFAEGHRFFDMMRCNKSITFCDEMIEPAVTIQHRPKTIDRTFYRTILPIDIDEINANPAIDNQQNPGYPKSTED